MTASLIYRRVDESEQTLETDQISYSNGISLTYHNL